MPPELVEREGHAPLAGRSRKRKAAKIQAILGVERELRGETLLEIGVGSGVIAARLAEAVGRTGEVWGLDVRDARVVTDGFRFGLVEGTALPFADRFDVVVSNRVLEHVGNRSTQVAHLREVARALKGDGIAHAATPNRWTLAAPHYHLPLLSWLPTGVRGPYVRLARRGRDYDCEPRSRAELVEVCSLAGLDLADRTLAAVRLTGETCILRRPCGFSPELPSECSQLLTLMPSHVAILRRSGAGLRG